MRPMRRGKNHQLQIRVSADEKAAIQRAAERADVDMSSWVLGQLFPPAQRRFRDLAEALTNTATYRYALAELNDFLAGLGAAELVRAVAEPPPTLEPFIDNYVAAMVETAAHRLDIVPPSWTAAVAPLREPVFCIDLPGVRLHLLLSSPPAFRRRNIFIDSTIGDRV